MPSGKCKRTGAKGKKTKLHKQGVRKRFSARHIDQVWEDVRTEAGVHDGKVGPVGTTTRAELDDDLPAHGRHYCTTCARYFVSAEVQAGHERSKPHKRRVRELLGARPHNQVDADWAGGLGAPDNGARLRSDGEGGAAAMAE